MLDIKLIREQPEAVQKAAKDKNIEVDIAHILEIDKKHRELSQSVQRLRQERNEFTRSLKGKPALEQIEKGKELKTRLEKEEHALTAVFEELNNELFKIPNPAKNDVKVGKDDSENKVLKERQYKEPTKFDFIPKDHLALGELLDIIDVKTAAKVSGARFAYLKNEGVVLELALVQFALEILTKERFTPVIPPVLIKTEVMKGLGYMENGGGEDMFILSKDNLVLVGTAEHALVPMHKDEVFSKKDLPERYVGFSSAFRREAGSYGKDTRGILRVHQFDKVEMVSFVKAGDDDKEHEYLLSLEEKLFQMLEIPYQVVKMCTGDLGFPAARKYDIEAWIPSQNKYREVTSVSTVTDFQSRRLNIKYQDASGERKFVNILNGTAFAIGRTIIAILENYQQKDGSILIPKVLQKYIGKTVLSPR
ncbi:serine--tRNA ligase [Patescibacteria group bacterium]|nr:serine--tRNA ligase [Patescibacteria group bacterium]MCL5010143.1 serine--tRNA ligase [Patescibacteria group bacterium]